MPKDLRKAIRAPFPMLYSPLRNSERETAHTFPGIAPAPPITQLATL